MTEQELKEYQKGYKKGNEDMTVYAGRCFIAYALAVHGAFNGPEFGSFRTDNRNKGVFHHYWNFVAMQEAGYRRIN